jgi:formylglycine-generating enzyme required for sulfatase activity
MEIAELLPTFVVIPATPFLCGTPVEDLSRLAQSYGGTRESYREEAPQHTLTLPSYLMATTPVTNGLYALAVAAGALPAPLRWRGSQPPSNLLTHPVVDVSWEEATTFCDWLAEQPLAQLHVQTDTSDLPHGALRLPSEAEWEHAARGTDGRTFPWGNEWESERANTRESGRSGTVPVGSQPANRSPYGCLDMAGNVWEWSASLDASYPYEARDEREDRNRGGRRILRGGCYANPHGYARCACRFRLPPHMRNEFLGFRLCASL